MTVRRVLFVIRVGLALPLFYFAVRLAVVAWHIPIEAGGLLFAPMMLAGAAFLFFAGLALVVPWTLQGGGAAFWSALADLMKPF
jgi:hypothetical protein